MFNFTLSVKKRIPFKSISLILSQFQVKFFKKIKYCQTHLIREEKELLMSLVLTIYIIKD